MEINEADRRFLLQAFVSLVKIPSASSPNAVSKPTAEGEILILKRIERLLRAWGVNPVFYDNGYLLLRIPASDGYEERPAIGFLAHVDTSPDCGGDHISPQIVRNYEGGIIRLKNGAVLSPIDYPELLNFKGDDIVTSTGETLLGADDKAGVAILMGMIRKLTKENIPCGELYFLFTTDEEVGRGMENPPLNEFKPKYAFTFDGGTLGEAEYECFNAVSAIFEITGRAAHLGQAKGKLINAIDVAAALTAALPEQEKPETTEGKEGYFCPVSLEGSLEKAELTIIVRDFEEEGIRRRVAFLREMAIKTEKKFDGAVINVKTAWKYRNMKSFIPENLIEYLLKSMEKAGIEPKIRAVRGGTDGAVLSELGIPCPNLFTGGHNFHSCLEWLSVSAFYTAFSLGMTLIEEAEFLKNKGLEKK